MRIAFVIPNLTGGGAARVASILCSEWRKMSNEVHLITFDAPQTGEAYEIDSDIFRHRIGFSKSPVSPVGFAANNFARTVALRDAIKRCRPDVVVSFLVEANVSTVVATIGLRVPVLISERSHPAHYKISWLKSMMRTFAYRRATRLIVQTEDIRNWISKNLAINSIVIPNPVPAQQPRTSKVAVERKRRRVVALGRLAPEKGFDRLINAFSMIAEDNADWDLVIFGEGGGRKPLETLIQEHGLTRRVHLPGTVKNVREELRHSDIYVHATLYEGYPNALIEALAEGLCVLATDGPNGAKEILQNGRFGMLVPDSGANELAIGLNRAINDKTLREGFACRAQEAVDHLEPSKIAMVWFSEIAKLGGAVETTLTQNWRS